MNKELIKKRFAKNLKTYNDNAKIQEMMAEKLLEFLDKKQFHNILEIGCGTGILTRKLVQKIDFNTYTAIDIVSDCKDYIKKIDNRIEFICADVETAVNRQKYDLIISNAAFQWFENPDEIIKNLILKLNSGGILLFSTFGKNNCSEMFKVTGKTLNYYSKPELANLLNNYPHKIEEETLTLNFRTPIDVLKHLKSTGVNSLDTKTWTKSNLRDFEDKYNEVCKSNPTLTYNPIYVIVTTG